MHILLITDPKQVDRDNNVLSWKEFITDATDAALRVRECKEKGYKVERYNPAKHNIKDI